MVKYLIHYFSGTGNTHYMVKAIEENLKDKGYLTELLNIESPKRINLKDYETHIFCFPVYGFGTPSIMIKYISDIKVNVNANAAIICTSAGFEGQALSHVNGLLRKKGFKVIYMDMVPFTYNWTQLFNPPNKEIEENVFKKADLKIKEIIDKITENNYEHKKMNVLGLSFSWIIFTIFRNLGRKVLGKTYIADESCVSCGKCKRICPAKAINMYEGRPNWNWNCESCQRCINMCPKKSIQLSIAKLLIFLISEVIPIWILMKINTYIYSLSIITNIALYIIMFLVNTIAAGRIIDIMEKVRIIRKIFEVSYTKKYRRNVATDFKIE
ncbi:EFR1 family ferrodoxin [Clostridium sp. C2-6-12]|uniref:EFR1 family ferrodoxin n=1 Tax=Clostridium sp. C2-6-12 TaxID=2698832 RepID=UPI001369A24D|nr:EFR1 family ferrodoxin [Clostridium sp. C2-6-12]